jgi:hypothetical protein
MTPRDLSLCPPLHDENLPFMRETQLPVSQSAGYITDYDSAEKPQECFDRLSMNGKISNDFDCSSVRPEVLEG